MSVQLKRIEFFNNGVSPTEYMGALPDTEHPDPIVIGAKFEKGFVNPPVGDDYYAKIYAVAVFENNYRIKASDEKQTTLNVTRQPLFDKPEQEIATGDTFSCPITFDCSYITQYEIDPTTITKIELEVKVDDGEWSEPISLDFTFADNIFTVEYNLDTTVSGVYQLRIKAYDGTIRLVDGEFVSQPMSSEWSPIKYVNKSVLYGDETDTWYWDNSFTDAIAW